MSGWTDNFSLSGAFNSLKEVGGSLLDVVTGKADAQDYQTIMKEGAPIFMAIFALSKVSPIGIPGGWIGKLFAGAFAADGVSNMISAPSSPQP